MAHMARVAGTDYTVAGGKTLIDGTAYSVVATREVEKTVVVSGVAPDKGNTIAKWKLELSDARFDWDKYKVSEISICGRQLGEYDYPQKEAYWMLGAAYRDDASVNIVYYLYGSVRQGRLTVDAATNGKLTLGTKSGSSGTFNKVNYTIVLEAKT